MSRSMSRPVQVAVIPPDRPRRSQSPELEDNGICQTGKLSFDPELHQGLLQPDPHKSKGSGGIHSRILKEADVIAKTFLMIFEWSWESREVLANWKLTNSPFFKKGKEEDPGNYRPVSLTSVPDKIREHPKENSEDGEGP
ncbi:hypothetical protein WISP_07746 [Willisornis vidua]|uniref:Uncharacterized protein n=1 Tax=Willisornis vidua TaxID=1566151 RepID=A0ABQ9DSD8_9PASS|nr:hypothetical protein WISP_07746 [Willisornis vidua]